MKKKYYQMETNEAERSASVLIFGDITSWPWLESDVASYNLARELQGLDVDTIDVHINSYGGEVAEALAIANTLMRHKAKVKTYVDGFACSAATIVFMAGDERIMSPIGNFLVHPASARVGGNAKQLRREADNLDAITEQSVTMYMRSVTKSREELLELMDEERFLTPEEVLEWGFATSIDNFSEEEETPTQSVRKLINDRLSAVGEQTVEELVVNLTDGQIKAIAEEMTRLAAKAAPAAAGAAPETNLPGAGRKAKPASYMSKFLNR